MSPRAGFLAAILENPADDTARLVYADWLRESPDAFDQAHGRFLAAGLTLHRTPEPEEGNEGPYYEAIREQNETAHQVIEVQARHLLGPERLTTEWAWDNDAKLPGRITMAAIPPKSEVPLTARERRGRRRNPPPRDAIIWERGCVAGLRMHLHNWLNAAARVLTTCPVEEIGVLDVPGLKLLVVHADGHAPAGWRLGASLDLPPVPRRLVGPVLPGVPGSFTPHAPATNILRVRPTLADSPGGATRAALLAALHWLVADLIGEVRALAGDRWPHP